MIDVHSLQVGDVCRWAKAGCPYFRGLFVVRKVTPDYVWYETLLWDSPEGSVYGRRFYNHGFQDIILVREAITIGAP